MTCLECQKVVVSYPCACGYRPVGLALVKEAPFWLIQSCTVCRRAAIRLPATQAMAIPICKWCAGHSVQQGQIVEQQAGEVGMQGMHDLIRKLRPV